MRVFSPHQLRIGLLMTILATCVQIQVSGREWTSQSGQTLKADFVKVVRSTVHLRKDGRRLRVRLTQLSFADQQYVQSIRTWRSSNGQYSVEARMLKVVDEKVTLEKLDGTVVDVEIGDLNKADKDYIKTKPRNLRSAFAELNSKEKVEVTGVLQELIETANDKKNKAKTTRLDAIREIGMMGRDGASALPFLRGLLLNEVELYDAVFGAMEKIGEPSIPTLVSILKVTDVTTAQPDDLTRAYQAVRSLRSIGKDEKKSIPLLIDLAIEIDALSSRGPVDLRNHGRHFYIESEIFRTLGKLKPSSESSSVALNRLLQNHLSRESEGHPEAIVGIIGQMDPPRKEVVPGLISFLQTSSNVNPVLGPLDPTLLAIDTLGEIGPDAEDALEVLRSKLDEAEIGKAAETAIAKIQGSD